MTTTADLRHSIKRFETLRTVKEHMPVLAASMLEAMEDQGIDSFATIGEWIAEGRGEYSVNSADAASWAMKVDSLYPTDCRQLYWLRSLGIKAFVHVHSDHLKVMLEIPIGLFAEVQAEN